MAVYKFKVLTELEAKEKGILAPSMSGPFITGDGPDDYACGSCNRTIAKSVNLSDITRLENAAFQCFTCKAVNSL